MPPQLTRLMMIFGILIVLYVLMRWVTKPESFYWYGHYRGAALAEVADRPPVHADTDDCSICHDEQSDLNKISVHAGVSCQSCHGPGGQHVEEPAVENIIRPVVTETCLNCHQFNHSRPETFPQVYIPDHNDGMECDLCHLVHSPGEFQ